MNKVVRNTLFLLIILFFHASLTYSQYYTIGNDPAGIKWKQINQKNFRLIYPKESEKIAFRFSSLLMSASESIGASLDHVPRKFPLILHPYSAKSNGYTIWAPRRVELFPRPPVYGGAESYVDHLLIHELRHMAQMDKLNVGITKAASWILGEQAVAAVIGLHLPSWFMEGDAVLSETLLSHSGRGRQAVFSQGLRALWLENQVYSYDKSMFGSYKDFVPNHYVMGYHLVAMSRLLGGHELWSSTLNKMGRKPFTVSLLSRSLKKDIGLYKRELYEKTHEWATSHWRSSIQELVNPPKLVDLPGTPEYVNYLRPTLQENGDIISLKTSLRKVPEFVRIEQTGSEIHLTFPGYIESAMFSASNDLLIWAEENPDPRWENRSFSNIYAYHLITGRKWQLTSKHRYFAPKLNCQGERVVCLEFLPGGSNRIVVFDFNTPSVVTSVPAPKGEIFQTPIWDEEGNIWTLSTSPEGKKIFLIRKGSDEASLIANIGFKEVHDLVHHKGSLYFLGSYGATNALYQYDYENDAIFLVSNDIHGINYLSYSNGEMLGSVYRTNGYKPAFLKLEKAGLEMPEIHDLKEPYIPLIQRAPKEQVLDIKTENSETIAKKYRKILHLFNFHSWAPASLDPSTYNLKPGLMLMSQNDLSSMNGIFGIEYDRTFKRLEEFASLNITGIGPKIALDFRTYEDQEDLIRIPSDTSEISIHYRNYQASMKVSYPFNLSKGRWHKGLNPSLQLNYVNYNGQSTVQGLPFNKTSFQIALNLNSHIYSRMSHRDLYPRIGYTSYIGTVTQTSLFNGNGKTYLTGAISTYLPGIIVNHSTRIYLGGFLRNEWMLPDQSPILLPRGLYTDFNQYHVSAKFDYAFPLFYPDWNVGSLLYIKRFKANLFFDSAKSMLDEHAFFMSTGIDITSDFFVFRIGAEIDAGVRILYNFSTNSFGKELLFNFSLE